MTITEMFEKYEDEYLKFEEIPETARLAIQKDICGLLYVYKLMKDPKCFDLYAEHDIIYLASIDDLHELTEKDVIYLSRCGIHYDEEQDCLADFV